MASTREVRPSSRISKPSKCCPIVVRKSATHATRASSPGTALASSYLAAATCSAPGPTCSSLMNLFWVVQELCSLLSLFDISENGGVSKKSEAILIRDIMKVVWKIPDNGWVKLNINGGRNVYEGSIYAGGVLHGEDDSWLRGFALNIE
ncbi:hypothetical protein ACOSQ2_010074 [Xanthoceras sorbifolium]